MKKFLAIMVLGLLLSGCKSWHEVTQIVDKRDTRTKLAVDLDLPVTRSGMLEIRKGDYFDKRLQTLKDKGVNFDGYYSVPEIANLLGTKSSSGINSYIQDKNIPTPSAIRTTTIKNTGINTASGPG